MRGAITNSSQLSVLGESARLTSPSTDIYLMGSLYVNQQEQARILEEGARAGMTKEWLRTVPGQFVLVVHDKITGKLMLIRDQIGQQPLYYSIESDRLSFATNLKELRNVSSTPWTLSRRGVHDYFAIKFCVPPTTLISEVSELIPGTYIEYVAGKVSEPIRYKPLISTPLRKWHGDEEWVERMHSEFATSFSQVCRGVAPEDVAILSSGGIDSSLLVAAYRNAGHVAFPTYYIGCEGYRNDKSKEADYVSRLFNTRHTNIFVSARQFAEAVPGTIRINDFPLNSPSSVLRNILYSNLSGSCSVLLSGEGADCLYSGYYIFDLTYKFYSTARVRALLAALVKLLPLSTLSGDFGRKARLVRKAICMSPDQYFLQEDTIIGNNSESLSKLLRDYDESLYLKEYKEQLKGYNKNDILDRILEMYQASYLSENLSLLAKFDAQFNLQHRHPFISAPMMNAFAHVSWERKVGNFTRKKLIVELARKNLPESFFKMPKEGFGVPIAAWFRSEIGLGRYMDVLNSRAARERGVIEKRTLDGILSDYQNDRIGEEKYEQLLWPMLNFELWAQETVAG